MNTENIAHYFYGSAPAEDELMNAVFSGENTVDALKTASNQHKFLYIEKTACGMSSTWRWWDALGQNRSLMNRSAKQS